MISGPFLYFLPQIINFFSSLMERSSSPTVRPAVLRDAGPWSVSDTSEQESHALSPHSGMTGSRFHKLFHSQHQESGDIPDIFSASNNLFCCRCSDTVNARSAYGKWSSNGSFIGVFLSPEQDVRACGIVYAADFRVLTRRTA